MENIIEKINNFLINIFFNLHKKLNFISFNHKYAISKPEIFQG